MEKTTVIAIHGGNSYSSQEVFLENLRNKEVDFDRMKVKISWRTNLQEDLGDDFDVFLPSMPVSDNADYELWKLWFEKIIDALDKPCILVGHSLGAMFLAKYYSENEPKNNITALLLVASAYCSEKIVHEYGSFGLTKDVSMLTETAEKVIFFHSKDDIVVPYESFLEFQKKVVGAEFVSFNDRGHFLDSTFPEIVEKIKSIV